MQRYLMISVVAVLILTMVGETASQTNPLHLETPREFNEAYQQAHAEYSRRIKQLQYLLSVRANKSLKRLIRSTHVLIVNRGRAQALSSHDTIYIDIALLDLLAHFSDELSLAEVKSDSIHQLLYNLAYAAALNGDKTLSLLDPHNTMTYTEDQKAYLWKGKLRAEKVIFDSILSFILAHEFGHVALGHERSIQKEFPDAQRRSTDNAQWNRRRREIELAADEQAARMCLNALIQPAQLVPWLDLNEIRRRYYGKSPEYPTTAQRIAVIQSASEAIIGMETLGGDLRDFNPLPPHRDIAQNDYRLYFDEFLKVRTFGQMLLSNIDQTVLEMMKDKDDLQLIASSFVSMVEQQNDLLKGAKNKAALEESIQLLNKAINGETIEPASIKILLDRADIGPHARALFDAYLEKEPVDWDQIGAYLNYLEAAREQFLMGISYDYMLANTALRWFPDVFATLQTLLPEIEAVPGTNAKARRLKPYRLDRPVWPPLPTFEERVYVLKTWDGRYHAPNGQDGK